MEQDKILLKSKIFFMLKLFIITCALCIIMSCSLAYEKEASPEESVPEFSFNDAVFLRYENSRMSTKLSADKLEQYKSDGAAFLLNPRFSTYSDSGEISTEGSCGLLAADTANEIYRLFEGINLDIKSENVRMQADSLKINSQNEQLTGSENGKVTITRDDIKITGTGFSASGVSRNFVFLSGIGGIITTKDSESENQGDGINEK